MYQVVFKNYQCPGTETVTATLLIIQVIHCQAGLRGNNKVNVKCPGLGSEGVGTWLGMSRAAEHCERMGEELLRSQKGRCRDAERQVHILQSLGQK